MGETVKLRLEQVEPDPNQPRKVKPESYLQELGESIKTEGLHQPITVRVHPEDAEKFMIVFGECRYRASKLAKLETIEAFVKEFEDDKKIFMAQLVENDVRMNMTVMETAEGYQHAILVHGMEIEELAESLGKSVATIAGDIELCKLPPEIKKALDDGELPKAVGRRIAELSDGKMKSAFKAALKNPKNVKTMMAGIDAYLQDAGQLTLGYDYTKHEEKNPAVKEVSKKFDAWWKKTASFIATIHKGENICHLVSAKQRNTHVLKLTVEELKKLSEKITEQVNLLEAQKNRINGATASATN